MGEKQAVRTVTQLSSLLEQTITAQLLNWVPANTMHTNECSAGGSGSSDSSSSSIMNFYKAERLRVMRMRQQYSSQPSSIEIQKENGEEMDVEVTNDENISSNNTLFAVRPHRLVCKRPAHSSPFLVSNVKRMRCD